MIYLISDQTRCIEDKEIKTGTIEQLFEYFKNKTEIGLDLETSGFDPYTRDILSIQLGDYDNQFVLDGTSKIQQLKPLLEDNSKLFIGHNLKFDNRFFYYHNIVINSVYDTFITEQIILNGEYDKKKALDAVAHRRLGVNLDKTIRGNIHREGLSISVIKYGADDVKYLQRIKESQLDEAELKDVTRAIELNNLFVPVIAYLEFCGTKLDTELWQKKIDNDNNRLETLKKELDDFIIDNNITKFIDPQLDLFDDARKTNINWQSPQQIVQLFSILNISTKIFDKESGEVKHSVSATQLKKKIDEHPIIETYISYREALKRVTTYGKNWFKYINPKTGRIHTNFRQWMHTGRMSSGDKDEDKPNLQNLPADYDTRRCIIAEEGNILINADYSGQENYIFADKCQDPTLMKMYEEGYTDMHSYTAWNIYSHIREEIPELTPETIKLVKEKFPKERSISKTGNFGIAYGAGAATIAENCNIPLEEGERFYNGYFETFKGVKKYFNDVYWSAKKRGYIVFNNVTRGKYFIPNNLNDGKIKNRSLNFPIQATGADMIKYAGILYWRHLLESNRVFKCKITIICHDEYLLEVPKELAEEEAKKLQECMELAADRFCKSLKIEATPVITEYWRH